MATADCRNGFHGNYEEDEMLLGDPLAIADSEHSDATRAEVDSGLRQADAARSSERETRAYHRIAEVRRLQGVTLRNVARRLGLPLAVVRRQEEPECDLRLSDLLKWQSALEVPVSELLVEGDGQLSGPVLQRSRMVKLMKTAAAIRERTQGTAVGRMVAMLIDQILELMPELADVTPWHTVGQRRSIGDVGRTARFPISDDIFRHSTRD